MKQETVTINTVCVVTSMPRSHPSSKGSVPGRGCDSDIRRKLNRRRMSVYHSRKLHDTARLKGTHTFEHTDGESLTAFL